LTHPLVILGIFLLGASAGSLLTLVKSRYEFTKYLQRDFPTITHSTDVYLPNICNEEAIDTGDLLQG